MSSLHKSTVDDIMSWGPCEGYPRERVEELLGNIRDGWFPIQFLDRLRGKIPDADLIWLLTQQLAHTGHYGRMVWWACDCAERALRDGDDTSRKAIRVARGVVLGTHDADDAYAAASDADTAYAAAYAAYAAADCADCAASDASDAATTSASAASDATRVWQLDRMREILLMDGPPEVTP